MDLNKLVFDIFRFSYFLIYVALHLFLYLGLLMERRREKRTIAGPEKANPSVSLIIPVHNEGRRIGPLLKSLEAQDYLPLEIIFVDDRSQDESTEMIAAFIRRVDHGRARIITLTENPGPNYKQYALSQGIAASSGDFFLLTDADCEVPPSWVRGMVRRMSDPASGAAMGPVLKTSKEKGFFYLYQCYEHGLRYLYLAGAVGLGAAGGGFGNNLIIRRACLDTLGGYDQVPPSPTEDAALISLIRSKTDYKVRAALGEDVQVLTQGEQRWKDFMNQTLRWNNGGIFSPDRMTRFNYTFLMLSSFLGVLGLLLLPFIPSLWPLPLGLQTGMTLSTVFCLVYFGSSLPRRRFGPAYVLSLLFTPPYFSLMTFMGLLGYKPRWKGKEV
ncbi:MAG: glycosyltransferase [Treponema sp.]|nr:glycosyltransferase [Treponema sp.]